MKKHLRELADRHELKILCKHIFIEKFDTL